MRDVTVRELTRDFKSLLPIPIDGYRLMKRDEVLGFIYPNVRQTPEANVRQDGGMSDKISTMPTENRWCELHFEKGVKYDCVEISWEDENSTTVVDKKFACPKCVLKYENIGRGKVYYGQDKS